MNMESAIRESPAHATPGALHMDRISPKRSPGVKKEVDKLEIGTTPVNLRGTSITDLSKTGGWTAICFIFGNEIAERMAYIGISVCLLDFLSKIMHRPFKDARNISNNFMGLSQISAVAGGFLADGYLGRYWTIMIFSTIYLMGLCMLTLSASVKIFSPSQSNCGLLELVLQACEPAKAWQMSYFLAGLYITAMGAAGIRPCVSSFGADQLDEREPGYKTKLDKFFNIFYLCISCGALLSFTLVVYFQMRFGWGYAFGSLAVAMAVANLLFVGGTPLYRHMLPGGSPLTRIAQVLVAAFRKRNVPLPSDEGDLYEVPGKLSEIRGSNKLPHTDLCRLLDKAAVARDSDFVEGEGEEGKKRRPWRLCTVTQVEELKMLLKVLPVWVSTILLSTLLSVYITLTVQQAYTLNRHIGNFEMPVISMGIFPGIFILAALSVYDAWLVPLARRLTGQPRGLTSLQRVGVGLAISVLSVSWAGAFERFRRNYALRHGFEENYFVGMPGLSAYWLVIQFCLMGLAEAFAGAGVLEFFYEEAPDAMRSLGSSFAATAGGVGSFVATLTNSIAGSSTPWLHQNINKGRYDYYFWFYAVFTALNFIFFLVCARCYKYRSAVSADKSDVEENKPQHKDVESLNLRRPENL
uniref:TSA: Wollemia nobilis Ref_Wollemi_Transcript_10575_2224 transcribed RNA sequence n=1 Tax=Wollemia nobilis TaxID=56998 RepID=A0A0C9RMM3_9CONI